jgi:hypothetical protein
MYRDFDDVRALDDAGLRAALAAVLAGAGEVELLVALARHDPDVHAAGMALVTRVADSGAVPWVIVDERLCEVRVEAYEACLRLRRGLEIFRAIVRWSERASDGELAMALARRSSFFAHAKPATADRRRSTATSRRERILRRLRGPFRPQVGGT